MDADAQQRLEKFADMVGTLSDEKVAEMADVSVEDVAAFREGDATEDAGDEPEPLAEPAPADKPKPKVPKRARSRAKAKREPAKPTGPTLGPTVRVTQKKVCTGPNGRTLRLSRRDVYSGEMAAWLKKHHADILEPYPLKE